MRQFRIPTTLDRSGQLNDGTDRTDPKYRNEKPVYSYREKIANDKAYAEAKFEYWYTFLKHHDSKDKKTYEINFDLANGIGEKYMAHMKTPIEGVLREEGVTAPFEEVMFVDYVSPIIKAVSGNQRRKRLKYHVTDNGPYGYNQYQEEKNKRLKQALQQHVIDPAQKMVAMQLQQSRPDLFEEQAQQDPKVQEELNQLIQQGLQSELYEKIFEYMDKEYRNDVALSSTHLLKALEKDLKFKFIFDEGYKLLFPSGREVYIVENDYVLDVKLLNPINFYVYKPSTEIFFQNATAAMYEEECDIYKVLAEFSNVLGPEKMKDFEDEVFTTLLNGSDTTQMVSGIGFIEYDDLDPNTKDNHNMRFGRMGLHRHDLRTPEGQTGYQHDMAKNRFTRFYNTRFIKTRLQFRENRMAKFVRRNPDPLTTEWILVDEGYTKQDGVDYEVKKEIIEEIWDITAFGYFNRWFFLQKRLLPNQYNSSTDYKHPKLSFKGADFNDFYGNTRNVSPIENAKPWIFKACLHSHFIDEKVATDIGNVMVGSSHFKPKKYTDKQWKTKIKLDKFIDVDVTKEGTNGADLQYMFRAVQMGNVTELQARLSYQQYLESKILQMIGPSPESLARVSPYMSGENLNKSLDLSSMQLADFQTYHNMVIEQVLNDLLNAAIVYLSKDPYKKMVMLPDLSQVALDMDWEKVKRSTLQVNVEIDTDLDEKVQQLQQYLLGLANAGLLEFDEVVQVVYNPEYQYLKELSRVARKRKEAAEAAKVQREQQMQQMKEQAMAKQLQLQHQQNMAVQKEITNRELQKAEINSEMLNKGYDVDGDNQHDLLESKEREMEAKERMHSLDIRLDEWYKQEQLKIERDKVKVAEKKVTKTVK